MTPAAIDAPLIDATDVELAWAAGLFDGEGSIFISRRAARPTFAGINLALSMTDREPVARFAAITGLETREIARLTQSGKLVYRAATQGHNAVMGIYYALRPYLSAHKQRQGDAAVAVRQDYLVNIKPANLLKKKAL